MPGVLASDQKLEVIEDRARTHQGLPVHILSAAPGAKVEERAPVNPNRAQIREEREVKGERMVHWMSEKKYPAV